MSLDFLEAVERQLVEATERGVSRRRWRFPWLMRLRLPWRAPTVGIAAGVGTALAASALAATLTLPASKPKSHAAAKTRSVESFTIPGAVPAHFEPVSFTAISEFTWWLLGDARCGSRTCTAIVRTTDGGPTFTRIAAPPTKDVSQLRFANAMDGWAYGPQLWSTHDGGRTWHRAGPRGEVDELAASGPYVFALVREGARSMLVRSPVGRDDWTILATPGGEPASSLWVQGSRVLVEAQTRSAQHLEISGDRGSHFTQPRDRVRGGDCDLDAVLEGGTIWGVCMTGMAPDEIVRSTDSGNTFAPAANVPDGPIQSFAAASDTTAVAAGQGPLERTTDGGATWTPVAAPSADWVYLGFTDGTHGVALGNFGSGGHIDSRLYYTIDAGASYHLVPIG